MCAIAADLPCLLQPDSVAAAQNSVYANKAIHIYPSRTTLQCIDAQREVCAKSWCKRRSCQERILYSPRMQLQMLAACTCMPITIEPWPTHAQHTHAWCVRLSGQVRGGTRPALGTQGVYLASDLGPVRRIARLCTPHPAAVGSPCIPSGRGWKPRRDASKYNFALEYSVLNVRCRVDSKDTKNRKLIISANKHPLAAPPPRDLHCRARFVDS